MRRWISLALALAFTLAASPVYDGLGIKGSSSGVVTMNPGGVAAGTWNWNFPTSAGTAGQPLLSGAGGSTAMTWGTLGVAAGGTALTAGTSGGVLAYTASGVLASSAALTANQIVLGGGAGAVPATLGSLGTTSTLLHGNAGGAPTFGAVALATDVSGTLPVANGGTGLTAGTSGGVLAYTASGTLASSGALTANLPVIGGGAGVAPSVGTRSGNTTAYVTTTGTQTSGDCVAIDASGNHIAFGASCGTGAPSGAAGGGLTGTYPNPTVAAVPASALPAMTGDVTASAGSHATTLAAGSASNLNAGTLAAARGGAGAVNGALKGNGSGAVSQAACADLSNGATGCSTVVGTSATVNTGTSGATIPLLNGANSWSGAQRGVPVTVAISTATFTPDLALGNNYSITLVHASCPCTLANPTNITAGQSGLIIVNQSATGSDLITSYGSNFKWPLGTTPTLSTGVSAIDVFSYYVIDATHIAVVAQIGFQ